MHLSPWSCQSHYKANRMLIWKQYNCGCPSREFRATRTDKPLITAPDPSNFHYCNLCWCCAFSSDGWAKGEVWKWRIRAGHKDNGLSCEGQSHMKGSHGQILLKGHIRSPKLITWETLSSSNSPRELKQEPDDSYKNYNCYYLFTKIYPDTDAWTSSPHHNFFYILLHD